MKCKSRSDWMTYALLLGLFHFHPRLSKKLILLLGAVLLLGICWPIFAPPK